MPRHCIMRHLSWCSIQCLYTHSFHWEHRCTCRQNSLKSLVHKLKTQLTCSRRWWSKPEFKGQKIQSQLGSRGRARGTLGNAHTSNKPMRGNRETQEEGQGNKEQVRPIRPEPKQDQTHPKSNNLLMSSSFCIGFKCFSMFLSLFFNFRTLCPRASMCDLFSTPM